MNKGRHGIVLVALLAGGCAVTPPAVISPADWDTVMLQRQALTQWGMTGRAAVAAANDGWNANMEWRQKDRQSELKLRGNFGIGGIRVLSDGGSLDIETSKGEKFSGDEAAAMLERALGVSLPLRPLRFWLLGVPEPDVSALTQFDSQGRVSQMDQDGWHMTYDRYESTNPPHNAAMPGRIVLEKGDVRVRVVVDRWRL